MTSRQKIVRYLYLDVDGIDSLFAQTSDRLETERSSTRSTSKKEGLTARLAVGNPLSFLQLLKAEFQARTDRGSSASETGKSVLTPEHKLSKLIEYLERAIPSELMVDLPIAVRTIHDRGTAVFLKTRTTFDVPQFYTPDGWTSVNETQTIIWQKPSMLGPREGDDTKVVMTTSIYKHLSARNGFMGKTSHDAILFRASNGIRVSVDLFGLMSELPDGFHIKPYAIWL